MKTNGINSSSIHSGQARASTLAQQAMEDAVRQFSDNDNEDSDYSRAQRDYETRRLASRQEGILRGLRHNVELKAQAEIRRHGGFQLDMFRDNQTGLDVAA